MHKRILRSVFILLLVFFFTALIPVFASTVFSQDIIREETPVPIEESQEEISEDLPAVITINYDEGLAPLSYREDGEIKGILVDVLNNIFVDRLCMEVEHHAYSWKRAQFMVKTGKSDAFCTNPEPYRKKYACFTRTPVIVSGPAVFTGINNPQKGQIDTIIGIEEMRAFSLVDYLGSSWARQTFPKDFHKDIHWVGSLETVFKMLAINRYDMYVGQEVIGRYTLVQVGLADDIAVRPVSIGKSALFNFGLRNTYPQALNIVSDVERALQEAVDDGTVSMIVQKYLNPVQEDSSRQ